MIRIIGNGGHAKVVRDVIAAVFGKTDLSAEFEFVAVGDNLVRKQEAEKVTKPMYALVHPSAVVSASAKIGEGSIVMAGAVVQANARIGRYCIINSGASVDHDCVIECFAHIAPGAHLCGNVKVGEGALVGVGVGIAPGAVIPPWSLVKARRLEIEPIPGN